MLNNNQIKLVQTAVKAAGIRTAQFDGRYRLMLSHYKQPTGRPVTSCVQLNNWQLDDLLAVCESLGWRMPGQPEDFYRNKAIAGAEYASFAQQNAIMYLSSGLGWTSGHVGNFIRKMTNRNTDLPELTPREAFAIIEALKSIYNREHKTDCKSMQEIKTNMNGSRNSYKQTEAGTFALSGQMEARDGTNQGE